MGKQDSAHRATQPQLPSPTAAVAGPAHDHLETLSAGLNTAPAVRRLKTIAPPNPNGLPSQLKAGIEALSGLSMDGVTVHRNSAKPAQLNAHAFAQGRDIHLAPGQDRHLAHEAWHVVQQAQGRVKPTMQMAGAQMTSGMPINDDSHLEREADIMGARAEAAITQRNALEDKNALEDEEEPLQPHLAPGGDRQTVQRLLSFEVDPETYTISNAAYFRTQGTKFLTGNKDYKHVTADTLKDQLYNNIDGIGLGVLAQRVIDVAADYLNLPGLDLLESHRDYVEDEDEDGHIAPTDAIGQNYAEFQSVFDRATDSAALLHEYREQFKRADSKMAKDATAFHLQNQISKTINLLEKFRDLMPLVNIVSGIQKGGREREANAFLKEGKTSKNIKNANDALWAYFDFAAIDEIAETESEDQEGEILGQLGESLPWLDITRARATTGEIFDKEPDQVTAAEMANYVAALMIANHIKLTSLSYPQQATDANLRSEDNIKAALDRAEAPVNRDWVARYAHSRL